MRFSEKQKAKIKNIAEWLLAGIITFVAGFLIYLIAGAVFNIFFGSSK